MFLELKTPVMGDAETMTVQEVVDEYGAVDEKIKALTHRKAQLDKRLAQELSGSLPMESGATQSLVGDEYVITAKVYAGSKSFPAASVRAAEEALGVDLQPFAKQNAPSLRKTVSRVGD